MDKVLGRNELPKVVFFFFKKEIHTTYLWNILPIILYDCILSMWRSLHFLYVVSCQLGHRYGYWPESSYKGSSWLFKVHAEVNKGFVRRERLTI